MKRFATLEVKTGESLRVKRKLGVFTNQQSCSAAKKDEKQEEFVCSSNHITVEDNSDTNFEMETGEAPQTLEEGGQSTIDDLKELNLGTTEEPRHVFVSALLTRDEDEKYGELLFEYKDVFAWSYKEMHGLDSKVATHRLAITKEIVPKKQPGRRFRP